MEDKKNFKLFHVSDRLSGHEILYEFSRANIKTSLKSIWYNKRETSAALLLPNFSTYVCEYIVEHEPLLSTHFRFEIRISLHDPAPMLERLTKQCETKRIHVWSRDPTPGHTTVWKIMRRKNERRERWKSKAVYEVRWEGLRDDVDIRTKFGATNGLEEVLQAFFF